MNGKGLYFAIAALLGVLAAFQNFLLILVVFLLFISILFNMKAFTVKQSIIVILLFLLFNVLGVERLRSNVTEINQGQTEFDVIFLDTKIDGDKLQISAQDKQTNEKILIQYQIKSQTEKEFLSEQFLYGYNCQLIGKLESPNRARNPLTFDYHNYLSTKQIHWILTSDHFPLKKCTASKKTFLSMMQLIRQKGIRYIMEQFPETTAILSVALIFGDRTWMPEELVASFQKTGLIHLLAISGLHVSFLSGLIFFLGIRVGIVRGQMIMGLILFLPLYALLTGSSPSVVRAVVMTVLLLLSIKMGSKRFMAIDAWSIALLMMLFFSPLMIYDIGFQLSFSVSFALLLSSALISRYQHPILQLIVISAIAQIASLPTLLWNFYEFSLISLPANVIFVPFFSMFLLPIIFLIYIFFPLLKFLLFPFLWLVNVTIIFANRSIQWLSELSYASLILGRPGWGFIMVYLVMIPLFFCYWEKESFHRNKQKFFILLLAPFLLQMVGNTWSPNGEITFIDVGQGDAILIKLPYNEGVYLIDTGGKIPFTKEGWQERRVDFEVGKNVVIPVLKSKGITTIDKLILTHGDYDHMGGAKSIIEQMNVKEIIFPKVKEQSKLELETLKTANKKAIPITFVTEGSGWKTKSSLFQILSPSIDINSEERNDQSIVIHAEIGGLTWLFTGDLEENGETRISNKYPSLDIDVLKVSHHGSKSSTTAILLNTFLPELAVISVGGENRYGHPHQEVLDRLSNKHVRIVRTDHHGAITYLFKGKRGTFSVMFP